MISGAAQIAGGLLLMFKASTLFRWIGRLRDTKPKSDR
jgi:hypothetical protein